MSLSEVSCFCQGSTWSMGALSNTLYLNYLFTLLFFLLFSNIKIILISHNEISMKILINSEKITKLSVCIFS